MSETHFLHKANKFDSYSRIRELSPKHLLRDIGGVVEGMTCIDLGCGTGTFALPMATLVGKNGIVYAVDSSPRMLNILRYKRPPLNIKLIQSDAGNTRLDNDLADFCLLAFILHEVEEPATLINESFRLLKEGSRICIVEWKAELDSPGPPKRIRISKNQLKKLLSQAGFIRFQYLEWTDKHYITLGIK